MIANVPSNYIGSVQPILNSQQLEEKKESDKVGNLTSFVASKLSEGYSKVNDTTLTKVSGDTTSTISINKDSGTYSVTDFKNVQVNVSKPTSEYEQIEKEIRKTESALKSAHGSSYDTIQNRLDQLYQARDDLANTGNANYTYLVSQPSQVSQSVNNPLIVSSNITSKTTAQDLINTNFPDLNVNTLITQNPNTTQINPTLNVQQFTMPRTVSLSETSTISEPVKTNVPNFTSKSEIPFNTIQARKPSDFLGGSRVSGIEQVEYNVVTKPSNALGGIAGDITLVGGEVLIGGAKRFYEYYNHPEEIPKSIGTGLLIGSNPLTITLAGSYAVADIASSGSIVEGAQKVGGIGFDVGAFNIGSSGFKVAKTISSEDIYGSVRNAPFLKVPESVRAQEFLMKEGITKNTVDTLNTPLTQLSVFKTTESITGSTYEKPIEVSFGNYPRRVEQVNVLDLSSPSKTSVITREMSGKFNLIEVPTHPYESNLLSISEEFSQVKHPSPEQISLYAPNQLTSNKFIELESNLNVKGSSTIKGGTSSYNAISQYRPSLYEFGAVTIESIPKVEPKVYKDSSKTFEFNKIENVKNENVIDNSKFFNFEPQESVTTSTPAFEVLGGGRVNLGSPTILVLSQEANAPNVRLETFNERNNIELNKKVSEPINEVKPVINVQSGIKSVTNTITSVASQFQNILDSVGVNKVELKQSTPQTQSFSLSQEQGQSQSQVVTQAQIVSQVQGQSIVQSQAKESSRQPSLKSETESITDLRYNEPRPKLSFNFQPTKKKSSKKYEAVSKRHGKLVIVPNTISENPRESLLKGENFVFGTLARSLGVIDVESKQFVKTNVLPSGFRQSKKPSNFIIQSNALSSFSEVGEIQQARRNKLNGFKGFNGGSLI